MKIETEWQKDLCDVFNAAGYYAEKWSSDPMLARGRPDLIVAGQAERAGRPTTYFLEVKLLDVHDAPIEVSSRPLHRKVDLKPRQAIELAKIEKASPGSAFVLVVLRPPAGDLHAALYLHPVRWLPHQRVEIAAVARRKLGHDLGPGIVVGSARYAVPWATVKERQDPLRSLLQTSVWDEPGTKILEAV